MTPTEVGVTLTDAQLIRIGRMVAAFAVLLAVGGLTVAIAVGRWKAAWDTLTPVNALVGVGFGALAWTILPKQPRNRSVWAYTVAAFFGGLYSTALAVLVLNIPESLEAEEGTLIPADLAWQAAISAGTLSSGWIPSFLLPLTIGLLLFPNGHLPSLRWRWALRFQVTTLGLAFLLASAANGPWSTRPIPIPGGILGNLAEVFINLALLSALVGIASLVIRYRNGDGIIRHQIRWISFGGALLVVGELSKRVIWGGIAGSADPTVENLINLVPLVLMIASFWIAVAKYRLYEIDVLISKSVTYLGLGAAITGLYVLVVLGPLLVIGVSDNEGPGLLFPILATGTVALVFEPVRVRMQRVANRLVYGERATPHEVLSQMTSHLAEGDGTSTDDLARLVAGGTGAEHAVVWLDSGDLQPAGHWSAAETPLSVPSPNDELSAIVEVHHEAQRLGAVSITKPRNDPITPADRELLDDVAGGAGLLLRNIRLNRELEDRAAEVRESRRRLIAAQDAERHRLERDLHDGAQQQVVALKVKLGIARTIAERDGAADIAGRVSVLAEETQGAVDALREVAHGIYPPLLESEGLEAALRAVERSAPIPVVIETSGLVRYARALEETVYFCVLEAIDRVHMSGAAATSIELRALDKELVVVIDHDGEVSLADLSALSDRVDAFRGTIEVEVVPNAVHRITTRLPADKHELELTG